MKCDHLPWAALVGGFVKRSYKSLFVLEFDYRQILTSRWIKYSGISRHALPDPWISTDEHQ
ncbi:MAG: hypothetical protein AUI83_10365 [Armatimonadetes bacterium 13_1_40CM_3_65_7]|nr:MAG: hypothetical protein AUI83_10365 [Armatimonadetes bacterium 13_1_40CM_3_65_7]